MLICVINVLWEPVGKAVVPDHVLFNTYKSDVENCTAQQDARITACGLLTGREAEGCSPL